METTAFPSSSSSAETTTQEENGPPAIDLSNLEYSEEVVSFNEQQKRYDYFHLSRRMRTATVKGRTYCFELSLPEADCTERIHFTEKNLEQAGISKEFRICLYDSVKHPYIKDGSLYGPMSSMSDIEYLTAVLLAAYGEFANYGMAYGYASYLMEDEMREAQYPQDWDYYDLNYLCFLPQFGSEEEVENVKAVALDFANTYVSQNGHAAYQELLEKSGSPEEAQEAREALLRYYKSRGAEPELSSLLYAIGGTTYSHISKCEYATFYTEKDWAKFHQSYYDDIDEGNDLLHDLLHCATSYRAYRNVFERFRIEMKELQALFDLYPYDDCLDVFLVNGENFDEETIGYCLRYVHKIYLGALDLFTHEYIHFLTTVPLKTDTKWIIEGFATYYSFRFAPYQVAFYDYGCRKSISELTIAFKDTAQSWLDNQEGELDMIDFYGLCVYWFGETVYDDPYAYGAAFIHFLITQFGEGEVLDYFLVHHDLSRLTDKSMEELMEEWKSYLEERFQDYEKAGDTGG